MEIRHLRPGGGPDEITRAPVRGARLDFTAGATWPLPYSIDWSTSPAMADVLDVVDGWWEAVPGGVRHTDPGGVYAYDRVLALGDKDTWQDYEVAVQITMHGIDPLPLGPQSVAPVVGVTVSVFS